MGTCDSVSATFDDEEERAAVQLADVGSGHVVREFPTPEDKRHVLVAGTSWAATHLPDGHFQIRHPRPSELHLARAAQQPRPHTRSRKDWDKRPMPLETGIMLFIIPLIMPLIMPLLFRLFHLF